MYVLPGITPRIQRTIPQWKVSLQKIYCFCNILYWTTSAFFIQDANYSKNKCAEYFNRAMNVKIFKPKSIIYFMKAEQCFYRTILYYRVATSKGPWAVTFSPDEISGRRWAWFLVRIYDGLMNGDDELCCYYEGDIYNNSTALMHYITSRSYYYIIHN